MYINRDCQGAGNTNALLVDNPVGNTFNEQTAAFMIWWSRFWFGFQHFQCSMFNNNELSLVANWLLFQSALY